MLVVILMTMIYMTIGSKNTILRIEPQKPKQIRARINLKSFKFFFNLLSVNFDSTYNEDNFYKNMLLKNK